MAMPANALELQALIQAAVDAAIAALPPPPGPPAQPAPGGGAAAPPNAFAINPAGVGNVPWDFQTSQGLRVYTAVTTSFDPIFDGSEAKLADFLMKIWNRAQAFGFVSILQVRDDENVVRDMTREWGCLTIGNVQAAAIAYLRLEERSHQASEMLRMLILASVEGRIVSRLFHRKDQYTVNVALPAAAADMKEDGPCMLFELIRMVSVETRATVGNILRQINSLTVVMELMNSNIELFNAAVEELIDGLNARRAPVPDLLTNLFAGYKCCNDTTFVKYINRKEDEYEDGTITLTGQQLMQMALEKYKNMVAKKQWLKKTDEELEFIAMQTELKQLKQNPPSKQKTRTPTGKTDDKKDGKKTNRNTGSFAWKGVVPKAGEAHEKTMNGKAYIYCPHHGDTKWVLKVSVAGIEHKTGCRKMAESIQGGGTTATDAALVAAVANIEEGEEDNEEQI
jgi:hypothetical protein